MKGLEERIQERVDAFVQEITDLVRRAAMEAVAEALGAAPQARPVPPRGPKQREPRSARGGGASGAKRSAGELERMMRDITDHVAENPGHGAREIADALGVATKDLTLPMKKLVAAGSLTTKGQKRATKYFRGKK